MKVSQNNQILQKTKYIGFSAEDKVELENKQRVHRNFSATSKREQVNLSMAHWKEYYQEKTCS